MNAGADSPAGPGCACAGTDAEAALAALREAALIEEIADESHFGVDLIACGRCGRRYVRVFTELIDWQEGNDPQAWMFVPVSDEESAAVRDAGGSHESLERLSPRRHLRAAHSREGEKSVGWHDGGVTVGLHD